MTTIERIEETRRLRIIRGSTKRFALFFLAGMLLTTALLMSHGWLILRKDIVPLWTNVLFSVTMIISGGLFVHMIDQIILSLKIWTLERRNL